MDCFLFMFTAFSMVLNLSLPVVAKYCTYDAEGELRYYVCPRNEYCCNFGCCLSPTFQFYQLWYYWLMVIFMFLLCSGGGWWYRYWLQGRYGPELGTPMPPPPPSSRLHRHHLSHRPARVSYHPSRDTVVFHPVWKPHGVGMSGSSFAHASPPPSYACAQRTTNVSLPHEMVQTSSGVSNVINAAGSKLSPYYQLYGPPPPYEAVVNSQELQQNTNILSPQATDSAVQRQPLQVSENSSTLTASSCDNNITAGSYIPNNSNNISNSNDNITTVTITSSVSNNSISNRVQQSSPEDNSNQNSTDVV